MPVGDLQSLLWVQAPVIKTISLAGGVMPGGILVKQLSKNLSGVVSPIANLPSKVSSRTSLSTTTPFGVLLKTPTKVLTATLTISATTSVNAQRLRSFSGAISPTGSNANLRTAQRSYSGNVFSGGNVSKFPSKLWSSATMPTGTLSAAATHARTFQSTTTSFGTLSNLIAKQYGGSLNASGKLSNTSSKILSGTISPASSLSSQTIKTFSGSSMNSGAVVIFVARLQSFDGTLTATGRLSFGIEKIAFGSLTPTGAFEKGVQKQWQGEL